MLNMYFSERKINLSKIGRFGYKFDTLETNWGEFELKMWIFVFSQTTSVPTSQYCIKYSLQVCVVEHSFFL